MRDIRRASVAGVVGATLVWGMFWLEESVLPEAAIYLPLTVGRLLILGSVLVAAWLTAQRWPTLVAGVTLAGAGLGWALHETDPLLVCRSDLLYRPCTSGEIGWMVAPAFVLVLLAGGVAAAALRQARRAHPV